MHWLGRMLGWLLMISIVKPMRLIYGKRKVEILNQESLLELDGSSAFIASNHIKPRNAFLKWISMPYDAFLAREMLKQNGMYSTALTSYDAGKRSKLAKTLSKAARYKELLIKGIVKSLDLIPLNRNENDPDTMRQLKARLNAGNLGIGIFPEGTYFRGYRKSRKLHGGVAVLAKRYEIPILPIFIQAYNLRGKLQIAIGKPIWNPKDAHTVSAEIRRQWNALYDQVRDIQNVSSEKIEERELETSVA